MVRTGYGRSVDARGGLRAGGLPAHRRASATFRAALVVILLAVLVGACNTSKRPEADLGAFEVDDPVVLVGAAQRTAALDYRYRSVLSVEGGEGSVAELGEVLDVTGMTRVLDIRGIVAGDDRAIKVKTSLIAGYLDGLDADLPLDPVGLQTEARRIDGTWYVRAPRTLLTTLLQEVGAELPVDSQALDHLVSGWVRVDPEGSADALADVGRWALLDSEVLQRALDPIDLLEALAEVDEITSAPGTFDGEEVTVVRGTVLLQASPQGSDRTEPVGLASTTSVPTGIDAVPVQVEVAIADDGTVRSASYGVTFRDLLGLVVPLDGAGIPGGGEDPFLELRQVVRTTFIEVGATDLRVEPPAVFADVELDRDDRGDDGGSVGSDDPADAGV